MMAEYLGKEQQNHVGHVSQLTNVLLTRLSEIESPYHLSKQDCEEITLASALHDIGKAGVNQSYLNKPGKLTEEEFAEIKKHTVIGASMLEHTEGYQESSFLKTAYQICRWHHERYDGNGYPDRLIGDEIPFCAQIVALADVYDALVSKRVYKSSYSHEQAVHMILNGECGQFNPFLLNLLMDGRVNRQLKQQVAAYH